MKADSTLVITGPGVETQAEFCQCVHCGRHILFRAALAELAAGKETYGYCAKCNGIYCAPKCVKCVPVEQQLENVEAGRNPKAERPAFAAIPRHV